MFGPLGVPELLFILVLALLIFGPRRLPELGRTLGKAMGEFRRATTELKRSINTEIALEEDDERPRYSRAPRRETEPEQEDGGIQVTTEGLIMPGTVARGEREADGGEAGGGEAGAEEPQAGGPGAGEGSAAGTAADEAPPAPESSEDEPEPPPAPAAEERR